MPTYPFVSSRAMPGGYCTQWLRSCRRCTATAAAAAAAAAPGAMSRREAPSASRVGSQLPDYSRPATSAAQQSCLLSSGKVRWVSYLSRCAICASRNESERVAGCPTAPAPWEGPFKGGGRQRGKAKGVRGPQPQPQAWLMCRFTCAGSRAACAYLLLHPSFKSAIHAERAPGKAAKGESRWHVCATDKQPANGGCLAHWNKSAGNPLLTQPNKHEEKHQEGGEKQCQQYALQEPKP